MNNVYCIRHGHTKNLFIFRDGRFYEYLEKLIRVQKDEAVVVTTEWIPQDQYNKLYKDYPNEPITPFTFTKY